MTRRPVKLGLSILLAAGLGTAAAASDGVGQGPWGPDDEIGRLNLITAESRARILSRVAGDAVYDLSVEYFIGMPSWQAAGDPHYRIWMTHTPDGTIVDDPLGVGREMNEHVAYSGAAIDTRSSQPASSSRNASVSASGKISFTRAEESR